MFNPLSPNSDLHKNIKHTQLMRNKEMITEGEFS